jgi:hypothetical protein
MLRTLLGVNIVIAMFWASLVVSELVLDFERVVPLLFFGFHLALAGSAITLVKSMSECEPEIYYFHIFIMAASLFADVASMTEEILFDINHEYDALQITKTVMWASVILLDCLYISCVLNAYSHRSVRCDKSNVKRKTAIITSNIHVE